MGSEISMRAAVMYFSVYTGRSATACCCGMLLSLYIMEKPAQQAQWQSGEQRSMQS